MPSKPYEETTENEETVLEDKTPKMEGASSAKGKVKKKKSMNSTVANGATGFKQESCQIAGLQRGRRKV